MSTKEAIERLQRSRQALVEQVHKRQRRHDPHEEQMPAGEWPQDEMDRATPPPPRGASWFDKARHAVEVWWHYHPAHMAVDLATPMLQSYGRHKPLQMLGIAAGAGALLMFMRPWKLISVSAIAVGLLKSPQLMGLLMSSLAAADFAKDHDGPER